MEQHRFFLNVKNRSIESYLKHLRNKDSLISYIFPKGVAAKWREVSFFTEQMNKRNIQQFREIEVLLFEELSLEQNRALIQEFCKAISENYNVPVIVIYHLNENYKHCHILFPNMQVNGEQFIGKKITAFRTVKFINSTRELWENLATIFLKNN